MSKVSGFSFRKSKDGQVSGIAGKKLKPKRYEIIKKAIENHQNPFDINDMFFNYESDKYDTTTSNTELNEEFVLFSRWQEIVQSRIDDWNEFNFKKALEVAA
jgi:hypothetical protein